MFRKLMGDTTHTIALGFVFALVGVLAVMFMLHLDTSVATTSYFMVNAAMLSVVGLSTLSRGVAKDSRGYFH